MDKSNRTADEIGKLKADIDRKLARDISKSRTQCQEQIECLKAARVTEVDVVTSFDGWIKQHEQIDVLLQAAEQRFAATLNELEHHVHGFGRFIREEMDKVIEGEVIEPPEREGKKRVALTSGATDPGNISADGSTTNASQSFMEEEVGESALVATDDLRTQN